ncbi:hypothetical protein CAURIC_04715 [Corynebacterium auriscanis]|nr:hypothetical protein CAURIC_04715 [Corynebacterium auriscanis]
MQEHRHETHRKNAGTRASAGILARGPARKPPAPTTPHTPDHTHQFTQCAAELRHNHAFLFDFCCTFIAQRKNTDTTANARSPPTRNLTREHQHEAQRAIPSRTRPSAEATCTHHPTHTRSHTPVHTMCSRTPTQSRVFVRLLLHIHCSTQEHRHNSQRAIPSHTKPNAGTPARGPARDPLPHETQRGSHLHPPPHTHQITHTSSHNVQQNSDTITRFCSTSAAHSLLSAKTLARDPPAPTTPHETQRGNTGTKSSARTPPARDPTQNPLPHETQLKIPPHPPPHTPPHTHQFTQCAAELRHNHAFLFDFCCTFIAQRKNTDTRANARRDSCTHHPTHTRSHTPHTPHTHQFTQCAAELRQNDGWGLVVNATP